ncbi:MAG: adenine phosphoribosyltransferase [Chloroflexi bacterium]|nr:adenine phosphoribosyltransferase [Chloroflexota bacterium]MCY3696516.1 adenine phosphoribosyltransferase [Chloroflexota bacterium]
MTDSPTSSDLVARYIRAVPDFPEPGIMFRDITPLLSEPDAFARVLDWLAESCEGADAVVGVESRGFILGAPVAQRLGLPFVPIRKAGKLPAEKIARSYDLEYGSATIEMHADALAAGHRVALIDDLLATGGTAEAAIQLILQSGATVDQVAFLIELEVLNGRERLRPHPVDSMLVY